MGTFLFATFGIAISQMLWREKRDHWEVLALKKVNNKKNLLVVKVKVWGDMLLGVKGEPWVSAFTSQVL